MRNPESLEVDKIMARTERTAPEPSVQMKGRTSFNGNILSLVLNGRFQ